MKREKCESERISPGLILLHGNVTILAKIVGEVVPILTSVDYITTHNSVMIVTEIVECLLLSHLSGLCVGLVSLPLMYIVWHLWGVCGGFGGHLVDWHTPEVFSLYLD